MLIITCSKSRISFEYKLAAKSRPGRTLLGKGFSSAVRPSRMQLLLMSVGHIFLWETLCTWLFIQVNSSGAAKLCSCLSETRWVPCRGTAWFGWRERSHSWLCETSFPSKHQNWIPVSNLPSIDRGRRAHHLVNFPTLWDNPWSTQESSTGQ